MLIIAATAALLYSLFIGAQRGYCAGGVGADGGFIDVLGRPLDEAPPCIALTLGPSPLVYVALGLLVFLALNRVMRATEEAAARRILERFTMSIGVTAIAAVVISQVWFALIPIETFMSGSFSFFSPFPFGLIESSTTALSAE